MKVELDEVVSALLTAAARKRGTGEGDVVADAIRAYYREHGLVTDEARAAYREQTGRDLDSDLRGPQSTR